MKRNGWANNFFWWVFSWVFDLGFGYFFWVLRMGLGVETHAFRLGLFDKKRWANPSVVLEAFRWAWESQPKEMRKMVQWPDLLRNKKTFCISAPVLLSIFTMAQNILNFFHLGP